ncbi:MAG: Rpn family recombination-promoting nuclease/putative transposase [Okeania sp. SIO2H7]|nr:Rpn family recombination-promoting nuclease/putative transposase [Okeania sp. SIO2H7]
MRFINPKTDYAFKKIFGSDQSQDILISFLNAIIYGGKNQIKSLKIIDPYSPGEINALKDSFLDVKAVLADKSTVIIEMQVANVKGFEKRVVYNAAKIYSNQLKTGEKYPNLRPVIALSIVDFILFEDQEKLIADFVLKDRVDNFEYTKEQIQLVFVELPKFKKKLSELETLTDKWIYFMKEAALLEEIPPNLAEVREIEKALNIASQANLTPKELEEVDRRETWLRDRRGEMDFAVEKAVTEAVEKAVTQAVAQTEQKAKIQQAIATTTRQLKKRFGEVPENIKSQLEDLPLEDLENLSEDIFDLNTLEDLENWLANREVS